MLQGRSEISGIFHVEIVGLNVNDAVLNDSFLIESRDDPEDSAITCH